jgi:hypothetical protein
MVGIMARDRLAQFDDAERVGVADAALGQRFLGRPSHRSRCGVSRLADRHRHDVPARRAQPVGLGQHVHGVERFDRAALREI